MKMTLEFGTDHIYNCDVFNEVRPSQSDPAFVSMVGSAVFNAMTLADPDAIWSLKMLHFADYVLSCFYIFNNR